MYLRAWYGRFGWRQADKVVADYAALLRNHPLAVQDMARAAGMYSTSFVPGDPHATAHNEGRRALFLHICEMAGLTPDDVHRLMKEGSEQ